MKRLSILLGLMLLTCSTSFAQEQKMQRVLIFPFKMVSSGGADSYSRELAAALGAELAKEGDIEVISGEPFISAVQDKKIDPARIARLTAKAEAQIAIWGIVTKLESGYGLELSVLQPGKGQKPRLFSADAKDMEDLLSRMATVSADIGTVVLNRPKIGEIKIEGNKRIQRDAILNKITMKPGKAFRRSAVGDEIKELYSMGYFDDVQIQAEENPKGEMDLKIVVKERPSISKIEIEGNSVFTRDEILDALTTKSYQVASVEEIQKDINKLKSMYEKKGYYQPKIEYQVKELTANEAELIFKIDEGRKSFLTHVEFEGRQKMPESDLLKAMSIKEKSWFWFVDDSGTFTREKLDENRLRIMQQYLEQGYVNVQVGAPKLEIHEASATVIYPIREGRRFQVRNVEVEGDILEGMTKEKLVESLNTRPKTWFKRSQVAEDLKGLTRLYNNAGYAYVDIEPRQKLNDQYDFLDITYRIKKGDQVKIGKVDIHGNERTRDKVIRRQLDISEGDLYSADKFEITKNRLEATEFFEAVKLKTSPGSQADQMNVDVEVMEKKTGSLTAGIGYSSQDGAMGNVSLQEKNMFGLGIVANAKANLSGRRNTYEGSVTYPYLFDTSLALSLRGYKNINKEQNFVRDSDGFSVHVGFPVYGFWNFSTGVARDSSKLSGFEPVFARSVVEYYRNFGLTAQKFLNISENSLSFGFNRDTRNNNVIPSSGTKVSIGGRVSGFGGDVSMSSYFSDATYYHPLIWRSIFKFRASASALAELGNEPIPFDRRILLGGISSIRGYKYGEIGPRDRYRNIMGGDRSIFGNVEVLFPLLDELKLSGVVFFDAGNAWNVSDSPFLTTLKAGAGVGFRWISPMGPIRVEYGWKVTPEKGEEPGAFAFSMGQLF